MNIVNQFLEKNKNFKLENLGEQFDSEVIDDNGCVQTLPSKNKIDGAFVAKLIRVS